MPEKIDDGYLFQQYEIDDIIKTLNKWLHDLNGSYIVNFTHELKKVSPPGTPYKIEFNSELERVALELNQLIWKLWGDDGFFTLYTDFKKAPVFHLHSPLSQYFDVDAFFELLQKLPQLLDERINALEPYKTNPSLLYKQSQIKTSEKDAIDKMLDDGLRSLYFFSFLLMIPFLWAMSEKNTKFVQKVLVSISLPSDTDTAFNVIAGLVLLLGVGLMLGSKPLNHALAAIRVNDSYEKFVELKKQYNAKVDPLVVKKLQSEIVYNELRFFAKQPNPSQTEVQPAVPSLYAGWSQTK